MRKLMSAVAALLFVLGFAAVATAPADARGVSTAAAHKAALPWEGHYKGLDREHRVVTFTYSRSHGITNFRVGHQSFPNAQVSGHQWHHTCHAGYCTRGQWHSDFYVTGYWNATHGGGDVLFEATHQS